MNAKALLHLPGLFEFYDLYRAFLPLYRTHREWFYAWCDIASVYGAPSDCLWGGGRVGFGDDNPADVLALMTEYGISSRLTFSNSLLEPKHLSDGKCNALCALFERKSGVQNGVIVHSDLLLSYIKEKYPGLYFVSSTTKVLTSFDRFTDEINREDFRYVVPDFRLNKAFDRLDALTQPQKDSLTGIIRTRLKRRLFGTFPLFDFDGRQPACNLKDGNLLKNPFFSGRRVSAERIYG